MIIKGLITDLSLNGHEQANHRL